MNTCGGLDVASGISTGHPCRQTSWRRSPLGARGIGQREVGPSYAFALEACCQRDPAGRDVLDAVVELDPRLARAVVVQGQPPGEHPDGPAGDATSSGVGVDGVADLADPQGRGSVSPPADVADEASDRHPRRWSGWSALPPRSWRPPRRSARRARRRSAGSLTNTGRPEPRLLGVVQHLEPPLPVGGHRDPETDAFAADHPHPVIVGRVFHSRWSAHLGGPYPSRMSTERAPAPRRRAGARRRGVGEARRRGAAQGPPPRRGRPRRRGLGRAHALHAGRHRHPAARHPGPGGGPPRPGPAAGPR